VGLQSARKATVVAAWFGAAFTFFFAALALLSLLGIAGKPGDAPKIALMSAGGAIIWVANWVLARLSR
jgi:hypothetical protein